MQYDNPFADEVRVNPYDDTPRLIFADFLDDYGDPLGQFIRTQISLNQLPKNDPARTPLELQETELLNAYGETWLAPFREMGAEGVTVSCFQRGLIENIKISARNFLTHGVSVCAQAPALHTIQLTHLEEAYEDFAQAELPQQIRGLNLSPSGISTVRREMQSWPRIRCIEQLTELEVRFAKVSDDEVAEFCNRDLSRLKKLNLGVNSITAAGANALAGCPTLFGLTHLLIPLNNIGSEGAVALANSPYFENVVELDVSSNSIDSAGVRGLASSITLSSLQRLNLRANVIADPELVKMESFSALRNLTSLDVRNCRTR